jgi:hypothetical protein
MVQKQTAKDYLLLGQTSEGTGVDILGRNCGLPYCVVHTFARDWVKPRKPQSSCAKFWRYRCIKNTDLKIVRSQMEEAREDGCL